MFDLDLIEQDWKNNSFRLSEEDIIEIYRSEGATLSRYEEELDEYCRKINGFIPKLSAEERLLQSIFGETLNDSKINERIEEIPKPQRKHLSKDNQKKVIEGSLYIVFDETRNWYNFFDKKLSMEIIYYICLEALMNSTKYIVHCEKPVFGLYVSKSIERSMIKYIARYMHITYREAHGIIDYRYKTYKVITHKLGHSDFKNQFHKSLELLFNSDNEQLEKPSQIYYRLRNEGYQISYIKNISSNEFMILYKNALQKLDDTARLVMQLSFDENGYRGLTNVEIANYLGLDTMKISEIRKKAIKILKKDLRLQG